MKLKKDKLTLTKIEFLFISVIVWIGIFYTFYWYKIWYIDIFSHFLLQIIVILSFIFFYSLYHHNTTKGFKLYFLFILSFLSFFVFSNVSFTDVKSYTGNNKIYYNNIFWVKTKENINLIINQIKEKKPELVLIVEKSYEFEDELIKNNWKVIGGNRQTECNAYTKKENLKKIKYSKIITTKSWFKICNFKYNEKEIYLIHPHSPISKKSFDRQISFFKELSEITKNKKFFLIIWDFNSTIYNKNFRNYFKEFFNVSYYSWHSSNLFFKLFLTLPIDHAISNLELTIHPQEYTNSDHRAMIINY